MLQTVSQSPSLFLNFAERFYRAAHPNGPKSSAISGVTKCPFRAAVQSKHLHTSNAAAVPPAVQTSTKQGEVEKIEPVETVTSHQCKCVVDGLTPKGW